MGQEERRWQGLGMLTAGPPNALELRMAKLGNLAFVPEGSVSKTD